MKKFNITVLGETLTHQETVAILMAKVKEGLTPSQLEVAKNVATDFHFGLIENEDGLKRSCHFVYDNQADMFLDCYVAQDDVDMVFEKTVNEMLAFTPNSVEAGMLEGLK